MAKRIQTAIFAALLLAGCQDRNNGNTKPAIVAEMTIPCALAGAADFGSKCTAERERGADGVILTLHHPDGGFRRITVSDDGRGVAAADGAEPAAARIVAGNQIEITMGQDRYRLPAAIGATRSPG